MPSVVTDIFFKRSHDPFPELIRNSHGKSKHIGSVIMAIRGRRGIIERPMECFPDFSSEGIFISMMPFAVRQEHI